MTSIKAAQDEYLCRLCREGMLYEVEAWIREGRSIIPGEGKACSLTISASRGFHSLVKLLLEQGQTQEAMDRALTAAAVGGNLEVVRLLLDRGANVATVPVRGVVSCPSPDVAHLLYSRGVDIETGYPLAHALTNESEEALSFFARYREVIPILQIQAAMALRHFVLHADERWITKLIRAGADPRMPAPRPYSGKNERALLSAQQDAAFRGSFRLLWRLSVRKSDDLQDLLELACWDVDPAKIWFLIQRGAKINDQPGGGSSILQRCLIALGHGNYYGLGLYHERAERAWNLAQELVAKGALWTPNRDDIRHVRIWLRYSDSSRCADVAELLVKNKAAPREAVIKLFGTQGMQEHLGSRMEEMRSLLGMRSKARHDVS